MAPRSWSTAAAKKSILICPASLGVKNAANIIIPYTPAWIDITNPSALGGNRRKFIVVHVGFRTVYLDIQLFL